MTTSEAAAVASIAERVSTVRARIAEAALRAGRDPAGVTLVGVSKGFPFRDVAEAVAAGLTDLGENRAQELLPKADAALRRRIHVRWHFIGHLQRNKVRDVLPRIAALHSLDSIRLVEAVSAVRAATDAAHPLPCYLEVNIAGEASKGGVPPSELGPLLSAAAAAPGIEVAGLMTVAPLAEDPEQVRPVFRALRELASAYGLRGLSMGMTDDYTVAIEEGATVVRVGRAIFGQRSARTVR